MTNQKKSKTKTRKQVKTALKDSVLSSPEDYKHLLRRLITDSDKLDSDYKDIQLVYNGEPIFDEEKLREFGVDLEGANFLDMRSIMDNISLGYLGEFAENTKLFKGKSRYYSTLAQSQEQGVTLQDASPAVSQNVEAYALDRRDGEAFDYALNKTLQLSDWWEKFQQKEVHETQLHGLSFAVWEDKLDPTPKLYPRYRVKVGAKTQNDIKTWNCVAIESTYTIQEVYAAYLNSTKKRTAKDRSRGWQEDTLASFLFWHSAYRKNNYSGIKRGTAEFTATCVDYVHRLRTGSECLSANYGESFLLYNMYRKEYDGSITRAILDYDLIGDELLYKADNYAKCFTEFVYPFTRKPWLEFVLEQVGIGHDIYTFQQVLQELINYSVENVKTASGIIINAPEGEMKSSEPIDIIPGIGINAGDNQISSSSIGSNLNAIVSFITFLQNKLTTNLITMGYNMNVSDLEFNNDKQLSMFALREARTRKNIFSLYYQNLRGFMRVYLGKLLKAKRHPDYKRFAQYMLDKGIDLSEKESFLSGEKDEFGVPESLTVTVSKTHGTGSQFADQLMADKLMGISGSLSAEEQSKVLELFIQANSTPEIAEEFNFTRINEENSKSKDKHFAIMSANQLEQGFPVPESNEFDALIFADAYMQRITQIIELWQQNQYGETTVYSTPEFQHLEGIPKETQSEQAYTALFNLYSGAAFYVQRLNQNPLNQQIGVQFQKLLGELLNPLKEIEARARTDAEARSAAIQGRMENASEIKEESAVKQMEVMAKIQRENAMTQAKIQQRSDMDQFNKVLKVRNLEEKTQTDRMRVLADAKTDVLDVSVKNQFEKKRRQMQGE